MEATEPSPVLVWCSHVCLGRLGDLLQSTGGQFSVWRARAHLRASLAGTLISSWATWPKRPRRWREMSSMEDNLVWLVTSWLETWSCHFIWRVCFWHQWWKASNLLQLLVCNVHVSAQCSRTGMTHVLYIVCPQWPPVSCFFLLINKYSVDVLEWFLKIILMFHCF